MKIQDTLRNGKVLISDNLVDMNSSLNQTLEYSKEYAVSEIGNTISLYGGRKLVLSSLKLIEVDQYGTILGESSNLITEVNTNPGLPENLNPGEYYINSITGEVLVKGLNKARVLFIYQVNNESSSEGGGSTPSEPTDNSFKYIYSYDIDGNLEFEGIALAGTDTTEELWNIRYYIYSDGLLQNILNAEGESSFTKMWDARETYNYS